MCCPDAPKRGQKGHKCAKFAEFQTSEGFVCSFVVIETFPLRNVRSTYMQARVVPRHAGVRYRQLESEIKD